MSYAGTVKFINESKNQAIVVQAKVIPNIPTTATIGLGDGISNQFFGSLVPKIQTSTTTFSTNGVGATATVSSTGVISGASINGAGLNFINTTSGACAVCFAGTPGAASYITGTVNMAAGIDLSDGPYIMTIVVDGKTYLDINFGDDATTQLADIVAQINRIVAKDVAFITSTGFLTIKGTTAGVGRNVVCTGSAAVAFGVDGTATSSTNPTGAIPQNNTIVHVAYQRTSADDTSDTFTFVRGDMSSVSVGDTILYDFASTDDSSTIVLA